MSVCECKQPAVDRVINMRTGREKAVCRPCGQKYIAKGGYRGPWWYAGGEPKTVRILSAHIEVPSCQ